MFVSPLGRLVCLVVVWASIAATVHADDSPWSVRASADAAAMLSRDQVGRLNYDRPGAFGGARVGYALWDFFDAFAGVSGGGFFSSEGKTGGLAVPSVGGTVHTRRRGLSPYGFLESGPGITGVLVRPFMRFGAGIDIPVSGWFSLGPALGYAQLFQWNDTNSSTDARYVWVGISLRHRYVEPPMPTHTHTDRLQVVERVRVHQLPPEPPTEELDTLLERALPTQTQRVELLAPVLFNFDSDALEPIGVAMLHEVARELTARPDIELVEIYGYADQRGSAEYNEALSARRAQRVYDWLIEHGVAAERLQVSPQGARDPIESGATEGEHEQNRRVVFRVVKVAAP
jgi:outer membrane protein OmpA-like peptidoglycan-associated protein